MGFTTMHFLFLIVLTSYHVYIVTCADVKDFFKPNSDVNIDAFEPYTVQVINAKIDNLVVHVSSKDNDFGNKTLQINESFSWSFRMNSPETTAFNGRFFWMNPDGTPLRVADFSVFDRYVAEECGENLFKQNKCFWGVADVGFYFAKGEPNGWKLKHTWS
uniref:S-protein homolog 2-like n=1 Tax=Erigeron canadensis TaxID=72917 RepID=UPI001CB97B26|nr:S-protein homolog 2-like [Erigeron canadensis]